MQINQLSKKKKKKKNYSKICWEPLYILWTTLHNHWRLGPSSIVDLMIERNIHKETILF